MQSWGVWGERVTPAYARDVGAFLEGRRGTAGGFAARVCGSADLIKGDRGSARGHVMNSFVAPPFGKTLADFAGAAAMRAKISPEAAAVHDRSEERQALFRGGAVGGKNKYASAGAGYGVGTREPGASVTSGRAPPKKLPPLPPTPGETALMLRLMLATLFLSDGTPMVAAGDEYGHSLRGHDDAPWAFKHDANAFRWDAIGVGERGGEITRFMAACAAFRRRRADLFAAGGANVSWSDLGGQRAPAWESPDAPPQLMCRRHAAAAPGAKAVAPSAIGGDTREAVVTQDAVAAWNCGSGVARAAIGQPPLGYAWVRVLDTALAAPADCDLAYINLAGPQGTYLIAPHAVVLLELAPAPEGLPPTAEQVEAARAAAERRAKRIPDAARAAPADPRRRRSGAAAGLAACAAARARVLPGAPGVGAGAAGEAEHASEAEHAVPPARVQAAAVRP